MRALATCALAALLLVGCSPAHARNNSSCGQIQSTGPYTVSIVSGDHQQSVAVVQPVVFNLGGPSVQPAVVKPYARLPLPLVVEVRDAQGRLADDVLVTFSDATPQTGVIGLGQVTTGQAVTFSDGLQFPHEQGRAEVEATPYRIGPSWPVEARVDPSFGVSNVVTFHVEGT